MAFTTGCLIKIHATFVIETPPPYFFFVAKNDNFETFSTRKVANLFPPFSTKIINFWGKKKRNDYNFLHIFLECSFDNLSYLSSFCPKNCSRRQSIHSFLKLSQKESNGGNNWNQIIEFNARMEANLIKNEIFRLKCEKMMGTELY